MIFLRVMIHALKRIFFAATTYTISARVAMMQLRLIKLANHLDKIGLHIEANYIDKILEEIINDPVINKISTKLVSTLERADKLENRVIELEEFIKLASNSYAN